MKTQTTTTDSTSQSFLTGAILFANVDFTGYTGYALKAVIGGLIWMVFKLAGDYLSAKLLDKKKTKEQDLPKQDNDTNIPN